MTRLLAVVLSFLVPVVAASAADLYKSNELGMEIAPVGSQGTADLQWVLAVERTGAVEIRTLTDHGKEAMRWELTYASGRIVTESVFDKGVLSSLTDYRSGLPVRQVGYTDGKETTIRDYAYSGGLLSSITVTDGSGKLIRRDLYSEGPDGRLRRAVREPAGGERSVTALNFSGDRLVSEWLGAGGDGVLFRYSEGALVSKEHWKGSELTSAEELSSTPEGSSTVTKDFKSGVVTTKDYAADGKILSEQEKQNGTVVSAVVYTYSDGHLDSKVTKSPGRREEIRYQYEHSGALLTSETTVNRQLVKVTHYTGKESYFEDLYLDGQVVLHVFYENGKKVKQVPATPGGATGSEGSGGA